MAVTCPKGVDAVRFARIRLGIELAPFGPSRRRIWLVTLAAPKGSRPPAIYVSAALINAKATRRGRAAEGLARCQTELATLPGMRWRGRLGVDDHVDPPRVRTLVDTMEALIAAEEAAALPDIEVNTATKHALCQPLDGCGTDGQAILNRIIEGWQAAGHQVEAVRGGGIGLYVQVGDQPIRLARMRAARKPRADAIDRLAQQMLSGGGGMAKGSDLLKAADARKKASRDGTRPTHVRANPTIDLTFDALRREGRLSAEAVAEASVGLAPGEASQQGASAISVSDALTPEAVERLLLALTRLAIDLQRPAA